jgi:DNA-binding NarL/FixJ family response regulator
MPTLTAMVAARSANGPDHIRLAICDDVREFRELMRFGLSEDPDIDIVGEAADGLEAVEIVSALRPDVVLLDLSMPKLDGLEVIESLRVRAPASRIIVLSGFAAARMQRLVIERGAARYLEKGTPLAEIRSAIRETAAA